MNFLYHSSNDVILSYHASKKLKPAIKRHIYRGPETERKLAFMLAHQLHLQDAQQQRPFPETPLSRLPGEIRNMIYEHLLVAPPSQSTRCLRVPGAVVVDPKETEAQRLLFDSSRNSKLGKVSYVAILQTCRQIYQEAYHVFYAKNSFHITNAPVLIAFLRGIGPARRAELTSLHLEGLVVDQAFWINDELDSYCLEYNIGSVEREELKAYRCLGIHPEISKSPKLLENCNNLSRLLLEMRKSERYSYFSFLRYNLGREKSAIYLVDGSRWVVTWPSTEEYGGHPWDEEVAKLHDAVELEKWDAYDACYPTQGTGGLFRIVVDIIRDPEEVLGEGNQSWVAFP